MIQCHSLCLACRPVRPFHVLLGVCMQPRAAGKDFVGQLSGCLHRCSDFALCDPTCRPCLTRHPAALPCCPPPPLPDLQGPLKAAISYTRVAQSAHFRHNVLAVPHKKSADGERLYYTM